MSNALVQNNATMQKHISSIKRRLCARECFFRLRLQNLFPGVEPPFVAKGKWLAGVLCCVCLRGEAMVSVSARCSKGNDHGFKCQLMF